MTEKTKHYPEIQAKADFPALEEDILKLWQDNGTFKKSVNNRAAGEKGSNEYVFYDGPPFANGLPHYGHLVTGYVKDIIPRYQTMRGHRVERRFGWDCHGLPAEMDTEKFLGISGRAAISKYGIGKFNETCKERVLMYTNEWEQAVTRQARWVAFDNDYKTMDLPYMESIIWAFKELYDKGLMYEGVRILPYSWAAETPVSNFETRMDNSYREREDPSVTVMFTLNPVEGENKPVKMLVWTTTPWTLPSNLALCVNKEIDYDFYEEDGVQYVIAQALVGKYKRELAKAEKVRSVKGAELVGRTYQPLFDYFAGTQNCFQVIEADYVSTEDGTGIVHIATAFGEDDMIAGQKYNIPVICPVDGKGCFTKEVSDYEGMQVFETNEPIIKRLKAEGKLVKKEMYKHKEKLQSNVSTDDDSIVLYTEGMSVADFANVLHMNVAEVIKKLMSLGKIMNLNADLVVPSFASYFSFVNFDWVIVKGIAFSYFPSASPLRLLNACPITLGNQTLKAVVLSSRDFSEVDICSSK